MPLYQVTLPMLEQLLIPILDLKKKKRGDFSDKTLNRIYPILTLHVLVSIYSRKSLI